MYCSLLFKSILSMLSLVSFLEEMFHRKFIYTWFEQASQKKLARKTKANRSKIRTSSVPRTVSNSIFLFISLYFFRSNFDNLNSICLALL